MNEIYTRRSIRQYTSQKVEREKLIQLTKAAMQAPSAANQQAWQFLIIEEQTTLDQIAAISPFMGMAKEASCVIVLLGDETKMRKPKRWQHDLGAATQNLLLEATHLGLASVWLGVAPENERMQLVSEICKLPAHLLPFAIVPIGYSTQEAKFIDRYVESRVHFETIK